MNGGGQSLSQAFPQRRHFLAATICFALFAAYGSLVPWNIAPLSFDEAVLRFEDIPLFEIGIPSRTDWVANVLLYVPIGFCAMATVVIDRPRAWRTLAGGVAIWIGCIALSIAIEFSQTWLPSRVPSQYDIQAQTVGAALGIALAWIAAAPIVRSLRAGTSSPRRATRLTWLLQLYVAGLLFYQLLPLDVTIHPREMWEKYKAGRIEIVPFSAQRFDAEFFLGVATDIALHIPLGAWCALGPLARGGRRGAWTRAILSAAAIVAICEVAQVFVYSRYASTSDVLIATIGAAIGASIALGATKPTEPTPDRTEPASNHLFWTSVAVLALLYIAFLFGWYLRPFDVLSDPRRIDLRLRNFLCVPFSKLYWGTEFNAATQFLGKFIAFVPLGVLAAVAIRRWTTDSRSRRIATASLLLLAALLGCAIELAQAFFPPHFPDVTDVLFYATGTMAGYFAGRYVLDGATHETASN
ncbi:MAG: VanZ family protein [Pirellulales bacterium]